jgi:hypothetical protein
MNFSENETTQNLYCIDRLLTQLLDQIKRYTERRGQSWGKVEERKEWTDIWLETPLQTSASENGDDTRKKK